MSKQTLDTNFSDAELNCPCGCGARAEDYAVVQLQALMRMVGAPLIITSSARCAAHNRAVSGSSGSRHLEGHAFDVKCTDSSLRQRILRGAFALGFNGVGVGESFLHLDLRPREESASWVY